MAVKLILVISTLDNRLQTLQLQSLKLLLWERLYLLIEEHTITIHKKVLRVTIVFCPTHSIMVGNMRLSNKEQ